MRARDFPIEFRREIEALLGGEADEFFAAYGRPHCRGLRLNARAGLSGATASPMLALGGGADFGAAHELASGFIGDEVESEPSARTIGNSSLSSSPNRSVFMWLWRASIREQLPRIVLISPLCTTMRLGWARSHDGKVLVE